MDIHQQQNNHVEETQSCLPFNSQIQLRDDRARPEESLNLENTQEGQYEIDALGGSGTFAPTLERESRKNIDNEAATEDVVHGNFVQREYYVTGANVKVGGEEADADIDEEENHGDVVDDDEARAPAEVALSIGFGL
jgi:hypothetical protein